MNDAKLFIEALEELGSSKGIARDDILKALQEVLERGFKKQLGGDDANVRVIINPEDGTIYMAQIKMVVEDVLDDFLEISLEDAHKRDKKAKAGDEYVIEMPIDEIRKATALSIKTGLKQKIAEIEKNNLYERYKDKIGEMIIGRVEKVEENGVTVSLDKTSVYLPRQQLIGDEKFAAGDPIKLFVSDVASGPKGAHIAVSRSNEGFLKRIFEEEIHEIYDGTIVIKSIAREAGERSKVAVYSRDPNVDPAGACIGPAGSRIQKVVGQLGNNPKQEKNVVNSKEKIDIITYSDNPALYIMEALKPAQVIGISVDVENKKATAVVKNDSLSLAIGKKGVNVRLACRLTGFSIDIKEQDEAFKNKIEFLSLEEIERQEIEHKQILAQEAFNGLTKKENKEEEVSSTSTVREGVPEGYVAPSARVYGDESISEEEREALEKEVDREEASISLSKKQSEVVPTPVSAAEVKLKDKDTKEETALETPITIVKTTKTLESLEKELEAEAKKVKQTQNKIYRNKRKDEEENTDSGKPIVDVDPSQRMSIYTEEELKKLEEEEEIGSGGAPSEDVDYDEYDNYYGDDDK